MKVETATDAEHLAHVRSLFREYAKWLNVDLSFQDFDRELRELPGAYSPPTGILLLCNASAGVAGCVAVRKWADDSAEMKRLFVRPDFRGYGCGRLLAERAVAWARDVGYKRMYLDSLDSMVAARALYERLGFTPTEPYRFNPLPGATYMVLDLTQGAGGV